jgi:deoxyribodipyrimidine photolyase-like uncharacterized protein
MRHFADELKDPAYDVHYAKLNDPNNGGSFDIETVL